MSSAPPPVYPPPPPPGYPPPPGGYGTPPGSGLPPPAAGPRGCWRTGLIGCGIVVLVCILGFLALVLYVRRHPTIVTDWAMSQVDSHMASDVTDQDRKDLHEAYDAYAERLRAGTASTDGMQRVRSVFMSGSNNEISREQVHELTNAFRRSAGLPAKVYSDDGHLPASTPPPAAAPPGAAVSPTP